MIILALIIAVLLLFLAWRERAWSSERAQLLQRIQDPKIAVQQFTKRSKHPPVMPIPINDDAAYREALERRLNAHVD